MAELPRSSGPLRGGRSRRPPSPAARLRGSGPRLGRLRRRPGGLLERRGGDARAAQRGPGRRVLLARLAPAVGLDRHRSVPRDRRHRVGDEPRAHLPRAEGEVGIDPRHARDDELRVGGAGQRAPFDPALALADHLGGNRVRRRAGEGRGQVVGRGVLVALDGEDHRPADAPFLARRVVDRRPLDAVHAGDRDLLPLRSLARKLPLGRPAGEERERRDQQRPDLHGPSPPWLPARVYARAPAQGNGPLRYGGAVPSPPRSGAGPIASAPRPALAAILLVALGLRLGWGLAVAGDSHAAPSYDGAWYDRVARDLVAGAGVRGVDGRPTAFFPPGYPAFLAAFYAVFGAHPALPKILNAALATLTCLLTYTAGRAAYGWRVGIAAAGLVAASPGDVFYAGVTLSEPLLTCALTGLVLAFLLWNREAAPRSRWLSLGLLLGAASLVRGIALPFAAVPIAAWLVERGPGGGTWLRSGLLALGIALAVAPWTLRNHLRLGYPILIASDGANALLIAHSPIADGSQSLAVWDWRVREYAHLAELENPRKEVEYARADVRSALAWMLSHPGEELALVPKRLFHTLKHDHYALPLTTRTRVDLASGARVTELRPRKSLLGLARLADLYFFGLLLLAAIGATRVFSRAARGALVVPLGVLFLLVAHGVVFWGDVRFHAPFVPLFAILAGVAVDGRRRPWAIAAGDPAALPAGPAPAQRGGGGGGPGGVGGAPS